ncbi:MAG: ATP-binding protein [Deltaproteobacteria bacterium]|nr:ATP-binding protein [Deltaproteobacteria bacterium]
MDTSKYKALYLQESGEHLSGIEEGLLALEKNPDAGVDDLFRHYHSIKGMSASMGYEPIQKLAHRQEDLLDRVRQEKLALSGEMIAALFASLDGLKALLRLVEEDAPLDVDIQPFLARIKNAMEGGPLTGPPKAVRAPAPEEPPASPAQPRPASAWTEGETGDLRLSHVMKVEGRVFDDLLATVGDLFMVLSLFKGRSHEARDIEFKDGVHMLGKSINTLHSSILSARMLPVADLTANLPRLVRDMAKKSGKEVELRSEGTEISLDRSILESLGSPLVHIIRNAVDHGIESPEERQAAGKPAAASISIRAFGRRNRAVIEVSDDGRGINAARIRERAIERGAPEKKVRAMTDKEACMLVCLPGVSSADTVTDTSGRGVGMDVVKASIEGLGGTLEIDSSPGRGTRIILELPRTTSIVKSLLVTVCGEQFLIPISRIEKVVEVEICLLYGPTFTIDGVDVPVTPLCGLLGMREGPQRAACTLIVVEGRAEGKDGGKRLIALKADDFGAELDAYVKPLLPPMSRLWGV